MLRRYKEIIYGCLLGLTMWVIDAAMHARMPEELPQSEHESFLAELFTPGITPVLFRGAFIVIAVAFGCALWRANMKRQSAERRARERAVEAEGLRAVVAMVNTFQHEVNNPLTVITAGAQMLSRRLASATDREQLDQIAQSAFRISSLIKQLPQSLPQYIIDVAGVERIIPPSRVEDNGKGLGAA